jgi:GntR family transcriptional repressor for pyruvate dehydrogenase complex
VRDPDISHFASMWSLFLRMNGGTYRELMEANIIAAPPIAAIGATKRDPAHIATLQAAIDLEASIPPHDGHAYMAANVAFHDAVAQMADNRALFLYLRGNHWITSILWADVVIVDEVQGEVLEAHKHVLKAIVDGNPKRAEAVLRKHLEMSMQYCERKFGAMLDQTVRWH